jgi:hypothetical protein
MSDRKTKTRTKTERGVVKKHRVLDPLSAATVLNFMTFKEICTYSSASRASGKRKNKTATKVMLDIIDENSKIFKRLWIFDETYRDNVLKITNRQNLLDIIDMLIETIFQEVGEDNIADSLGDSLGDMLNDLTPEYVKTLSIRQLCALYSLATNEGDIYKPSGF